MSKKKDPVICRYLLYTRSDRTQAYGLDVENNGKDARFYVNGNTVMASAEDEAAVLKALTALDIAFGNLILHTQTREDN